MVFPIQQLMTGSVCTRKRRHLRELHRVSISFAMLALRIFPLELGLFGFVLLICVDRMSLSFTAMAYSSPCARRFPILSTLRTRMKYVGDLCTEFDSHCKDV